jgi:hypothetical protein
MRLFHHKVVLQEAFLVEPKSQKEALVGEKGDNSEVPLTKVLMFFTSKFFSLVTSVFQFFILFADLDSALKKYDKFYKSLLNLLNPSMIFSVEKARSH